MTATAITVIDFLWIAAWAAGWGACCYLVVHGLCVLNNLTCSASHLFRAAHLLFTLAAAGLVLSPLYGGQGLEELLAMLLVGVVGRILADPRKAPRPPELLGDRAIGRAAQ